MKIYCASCGRQIVSYNCSNNYAVGSTDKPVKRGFGNEFFCYECSEELDENGCFNGEL